MPVPRWNISGVIKKTWGIYNRVRASRMYATATMRKIFPRNGRVLLRDSAGMLRRIHGGACNAERRARLFPRDAALFDLVQKCFVADTELFGGATAIPADVAKRVLDDRPLRFERGR